MSVEKAASYIIVGWAAFFALFVLLIAFGSSPNVGLFGFAGLIVVAFGWYYRNYW